MGKGGADPVFDAIYAHTLAGSFAASKPAAELVSVLAGVAEEAPPACSLALRFSCRADSRSSYHAATHDRSLNSSLLPNIQESVNGGFQTFWVPEGHHPIGTTLREAFRGNLPLRGLWGNLPLRGLCGGLLKGSAGVSPRVLRGSLRGFCGALRGSAGVHMIFRGFSTLGFWPSGTVGRTVVRDFWGNEIQLPPFYLNLIPFLPQLNLFLASFLPILNLN